MLKERIITGITLKKQKQLADRILKEVVIPQSILFIKSTKHSLDRKTITVSGKKITKIDWQKRTARKLYT